jgi:hypothetical protein
MAVCVNGVLMALGVPAVAWLDRAALFVTLVVIGVAGIAVTYFFWGHDHLVRTLARIAD